MRRGVKLLIICDINCTNIVAVHYSTKCQIASKVFKQFFAKVALT